MSGGIWPRGLSYQPDLLFDAWRLVTQMEIGKSLRQWATDWVAGHGPFRNQAEAIVRNVMSRQDCQPLAQRWELAATLLNPLEEAIVKRVLAMEAVTFARQFDRRPWWMTTFESLATRLRKTPIEFDVSEIVVGEMAEVYDSKEVQS